MTRRPPTRVMRDVAAEAALALLGRPGRAAATALSVVVGLAAFVTASGLTATARASVNERFAEFSAAEVTLADSTPNATSPAFGPAPRLRWPAFRACAGTESCGRSRRARRPRRPCSGRSYRARRTASTWWRQRRGCSADGASYKYGSGFNAADDRVHGNVVVLGPTAASELGVRALDGQESIVLDGVPFTVVGELKAVQSEPTLLTDAIVPDVTAQRLWGLPRSGSQLDISVDPAAALEVEHEVPLMLHPEDPTRLQAITAVQPPILQAAVTGDLTALLTVVTLAALAISIAGIAVTMYSSISERAFEVGLRRALGATRLQIAGQFVVESLLIGAGGAIVGIALGVCAVVAISQTHGWLPVLDVGALALAPLLGATVGGLAGLLPAIRAGRLDPAEALRR